MKTNPPAAPNARTPKLYPIPASTRKAKCKGPNCGATIYFVNNLPLDPNVVGGVTPLWPLRVDGGEPRDGLGAIHHAVCPDKADFRRKKEREAEQHGLRLRP